MTHARAVPHRRNDGGRLVVLLCALSVARAGAWIPGAPGGRQPWRSAGQVRAVSGGRTCAADSVRGGGGGGGGAWVRDRAWLRCSGGATADDMAGAGAGMEADQTVAAVVEEDEEDEEEDGGAADELEDEDVDEDEDEDDEEEEEEDEPGYVLLVDPMDRNGQHMMAVLEEWGIIAVPVLSQSVAEAIAANSDEDDPSLAHLEVLVGWLVRYW